MYISNYTMNKMDKIIEEFREEYKKEDCNSWDCFFSKKYDLILQNFDLLYEETQKNKKDETNTYESETFQNYVDRHTVFQKIGGYNYQVFCKSMNDEKYKKKIYEIYKKDEKIKKIKNLLIRFIKCEETVSSCIQ